MGYLFLLLYISVIFIRPHEWFSVGAVSPIIRIMIMLTFVTYLFSRDKKLAPQYWLVVCMGISIGITDVFQGWAGGAIFHNMQFLPAAVLPMVVCGGLITSYKKQMGVMVVCLIACLFMVHNGYTQHLNPDGWGWAVGTRLVEDIRITYVGIFSDPNDIAMFFVMCIPFAAYFMSKSKFFFKMIFMGVLAALLYGVYLTNSRGGLLGVVIMAAAYFTYRYGIKKAIFFGGASLPVVMVIMSKFRTIEQGESADGRVESWYAGMYEFFLHYPVFGIGKSAFVDWHQLTAHNSFILVIAELGFVGYFLWLSILVISIMMVLRTVIWAKKLPELEYANLSNTVKTEISLSTVLVFSFIGYLVTCFFLSRSYIILLYVFMGMAIASYYRVIKDVPELEIKTFGPYYKRVFVWAIYSIIFFFILVKILI